MGHVGKLSTIELTLNPLEIWKIQENEGVMILLENISI